MIIVSTSHWVRLDFMRVDICLCRSKILHCRWARKIKWWVICGLSIFSHHRYNIECDLTLTKCFSLDCRLIRRCRMRCDKTRTYIKTNVFSRTRTSISPTNQLCSSSWTSKTIKLKWIVRKTGTTWTFTEVSSMNKVSWRSWTIVLVLNWNEFWFFQKIPRDSATGHTNATFHHLNFFKTHQSKMTRTNIMNSWCVLMVAMSHQVQLLIIISNFISVLAVRQFRWRWRIVQSLFPRLSQLRPREQQKLLAGIQRHHWREQQWKLFVSNRDAIAGPLFYDVAAFLPFWIVLGVRAKTKQASSVQNSLFDGSVGVPQVTELDVPFHKFPFHRD